MSKRAEEAALRTYPISTPPSYIDGHSLLRQESFIKGFEQAEKDCALTWEDVKLICDLKMELELDSDDLPPRSQELYEAVLRAFKQRKEDLKILLNIKL